MPRLRVDSSKEEPPLTKSFASGGASIILQWNRLPSRQPGVLGPDHFRQSHFNRGLFRFANTIHVLLRTNVKVPVGDGG